jgi:hypothetical protein
MENIPWLMVPKLPKSQAVCQPGAHGSIVAPKDDPGTAIKVYKKTDNGMSFELLMELVARDRCGGVSNSCLTPVTAVYETPRCYGMAMPAAPTDLCDLLGDTGYEVNFVKTLRIFRDLARALWVMHSNGMAHRDVKDPNVLVVDRTTCQVQLCDMSIACFVDHVIRDPFVPFTVGFKAPELVAYEKSREKLARLDWRAADVFAAGAVMAKVILIAAGSWFEIRPPKLSQFLHGAGLDPRGRALVASMMAKDPGARPTALQVLTTLECSPEYLSSPARPPWPVPEVSEQDMLEIRRHMQDTLLPPVVEPVAASIFAQLPKSCYQGKVPEHRMCVALASKACFGMPEVLTMPLGKMSWSSAHLTQVCEAALRSSGFITACHRAGGLGPLPTAK